MFIKLKQKIKKYWAKILSKKFSGFGIFKFPSRKVLLGVFLMAMIFGGIFGGVNNVKAEDPPPGAPINHCFGSLELCNNAIVNSCSSLSEDNPWYIKFAYFWTIFLPGPQDTCESTMKCVQDGPPENPWCIRARDAVEFVSEMTKKGASGSLDIIGKAIAMILEKIANIILAIVYAICWLLLHLAGVFVDLSANFLDATFNSNLYRQMFVESSIIATGWTIIRDICNMFFILILLVIALATILRIQAYKAQSLLLSLLIAALLINFSKPIVLLAIDASQILMYQFVNLMGGSFIDSSVNQKLVGEGGFTEVFIKAFGGWDKISTIIMGNLTNAVSWVLAIMFALFFLVVLALVYAAMALFMIIRLVALTILLIFSPIGFFFQILPQTKGYASKYWGELFKYAIFGPLMAFFIYLAGSLAISVPINLPSELQIVADSPNGATFIALLGNLLHYVVILVFLYASVWIARQMGIWGADKVQAMTFGKAAAVGGVIGGAVGGYLGGAAGRAGTWTAKKADSVSGGRLGRAKEKLKKIPGGSAIIVAESKIKTKQRKSTEGYESTLSSQSSPVVRARGNSVLANPEESAAAIKILAARDDLDKVKDKKLFEKAKRGGLDEDAIYNRMPAWAEDKQREVKRIAEEGKVSQISSESLKDKDIMDALRGQLSSDEMKRIYRVWGKEQQDAAEEGLKKAMKAEATPFSDDDKKRRNLFAGLSGKTKEAFEIKPGVTTTAGDNAAKEYVLKMTPGDIGKVDKKDDLEVVGAYITKGQLTSIRGEISADQKKVMKDFIRTTRSGSDEDNYVNTNPGWAV